jgi:hypothetical protein
MFDHIISTPRIRKKILKAHHHLSVFVIVLGVTTTVIALNLNIPQFQTVSITQASSTPASVRLLGGSGRESVVGPLQLWPLATLEARIADSSARVDSFQFRLEGTYAASGIEGLALFIDGVQVGAPAIPDAEHMVRYTLETVRLSKGTHIFTAKMSTNSSLGAATFQAVFDPYTGFMTDTGQVVQMQLPYRSELLQVVDHGTLGVFAQQSAHSPLLYLYGQAEDFRVQGMEFEASQDLTGARLDFFQGNQFLATGEFIGSKTSVSFDDISLLAFRGKNTILTVRTTPARLSAATINLIKVKAQGSTSQLPLEIESALQLLP